MNAIKTWRKVPILLLGYAIKRWQDADNRTYWFYDHPGLSVWQKFDAMGPSHLQYRSRYGFLVTWPFCFHVWVMPELGREDRNGVHIPGTEKGWYFRVGFVWRPGQAGYEPSWYGPFNQHWD